MEKKMGHGKIYHDLTETIGNTPLVQINRMVPAGSARVVFKLEFFNPLSSVKDRMANAMIDAALKSGALKPGMRIIEPTSGNTGIGLAFVAAVRGFPITIVMPETMSLERKVLLKMFGVDLVLTPGDRGMPGAILGAKKLMERNPNAFMPAQFENPANPQIHYDTTAEEIWNDSQGKVDIVVAGVGTGGTLTGIGRKLKEKNPKIKMIAVEPVESPVLSGGKPSPHKIAGIGAGFIPQNFDAGICDEVIQISSQEAFDTSREVICKEGLPIGISSGAIALAAFKVAVRPENKGKLIVAIIASSTERYLSTLLAEKAREEVAAIKIMTLD